MQINPQAHCTISSHGDIAHHYARNWMGIPQMKQGDRTTIATVLTQKIGDETTISELAAGFEFGSQSITYRRQKV